MMKIAFVGQPFERIVPHAITSSLAILTYEIAHRMARSCDVTVYTKADSRRRSVIRDQGVRYRFLPVGSDLRLIRVLGKLPVFRNPKRPLFASVLYYFGYVLQVANSLRSQRFDIVHIHTFPNFVPIIRALNPKIKIVLHMNDHTLTQRDRKMTERRLRNVDLIVGCSKHITGNIRNCFPHLASRCHTIYNGVDVGHFGGDNVKKTKMQNNPKRLLFVGRISPEKGLHVLLDAFQQVVNLHPDTQLEVVGPKIIMSKLFIDPNNEDPYLEGLTKFFSPVETSPAIQAGMLERKAYSNRKNYMEYLEEKLSSGLANNVIYGGVIPHHEMVKHYRNADILVIPSLWNEPFGIPLVEAMATGVPAIATRGGAFTEIVEEGKTGLLVQKGSANELADAILRLLLDEALRKSMGEAARRRTLELFSWDRIVKNLFIQYERIANGHAA